MEKYDEVLLENPFFKEFDAQIDNFQEKAASNHWTVCVPQAGRIPKFGFQLDDIENHILIASTTNENAYKTLNGKDVVIRNKVITTGNNFSEIQDICILFDEKFYCKNVGSFIVLCVEKMLDGYAGDGTADTLFTFELNSLKDCVDFLYKEIGNQRILYMVGEYIEHWNNENQNLEFETLLSMRDLTSALYTKIFQAVRKDSSLKKKVWGNKFLTSSLELAVETFTMHGVCKRVMTGLTSYLAREDAQLNKIIRNLADIQIRDLNIKSEYISAIPRAKHELSRIDWYTTPLDKINCIKRAIAALLKLKRNHLSSSTLATDDLLPILVFIVLKIGIPNWLAHFSFMKNFRLSHNRDECEKDEQGYYLTSLEAALEHIRNGVLLGSTEPESLLENSSDVDVSYGFQDLCYIGDHTSNEIKIFFDLVRQGNCTGIQEMLSKTNEHQKNTIEQLCHPLCSCDRCEYKQKQMKSESFPTLHSRDSKGCTALHVASECGQDYVVEYLIKLDANVNATDYKGRTPLHLACRRGHQNSTLMLLHHNALINVVDNDGNTPLHLCALNGHEDCVKALLYCDEYMHKCSIQVNATNDNGDTPLHFAARWGFDGIVEILLEFGACIESKNKRLQTPLDCSHNANVLHLLESANDEFPFKHYEGFVHIEHPNQPILPVVTVVQQKKEERKTSTATLAPVKFTRKLNNMMKAVVEGDINLACFYLGLEIEGESNETDSMDQTNQKLCHPLCQCRKCSQLQKSPKNLPSAGTDCVSVNSSTQDGKTPLHVACIHGHQQLAKILLENGANPNAATTLQGFSPLHVACQHGQTEAVQLLLRFEASVNLSDSLGRTPLHLCCLNNNFPLSSVLIKKGASVNQTSHKGNSPLHEAARCNNFPLAELLLEHGANPSLTNKKRLATWDLATDGSVKRLLRQSVTEMLHSSSVPSIATSFENHPPETQDHKDDPDAPNNGSRNAERCGARVRLLSKQKAVFSSCNNITQANAL